MASFALISQFLIINDLFLFFSFSSKIANLLLKIFSLFTPVLVCLICESRSQCSAWFIAVGTIKVSKGLRDLDLRRHRNMVNGARGGSWGLVGARDAFQLFRRLKKSVSAFKLENVHVAVKETEWKALKLKNFPKVVFDSYKEGKVFPAVCFFFVFFLIF